MDLIWGLLIGGIFGFLICFCIDFTKAKRKESEQAIQDRLESERLAEEAKELGKHYN